MGWAIGQFLGTNPFSEKNALQWESVVFFSGALFVPHLTVLILLLLLRMSAGKDEHEDMEIQLG